MNHLNLTEDLSGDRAVSHHGFQHLDNGGGVLQEVLGLCRPASDGTGEDTCVLLRNELIYYYP